MNVKQLMEILIHCNPEDEVITEGCDCFGDVAEIERLPDGCYHNHTLVRVVDGPCVVLLRSK